MAVPFSEQVPDSAPRLDAQLAQRGPQSSLQNIQPFGYLLIHDRDLTKIPLYFMPQEIQDSYQPQWNDQPVPGRSEPVRSYAHGGPRHVSCTLIFVAQGGTDDSPLQPKAEVNDPVLFIRSAMYPRYGTVVSAPPMVTLQVGRFLTIKGILMQAEVRWMGPWDVVNGMWPMRAELAVTIDQVNPKALGRADALPKR